MAPGTEHTMKKSFHNLFIWETAVNLSVSIWETTRSFPAPERYVLAAQMQRCAVSIPSNIAEGAGRLSGREMRKYLGIARGSACELETQLEIARRCGLIDDICHSDLDHRLALINTGINRWLVKLKKRC